MKSPFQKKWLFFGLSLLIHLALLFFLLRLFFPAVSTQNIRVHYVSLKEGILGGGEKVPDQQSKKVAPKINQGSAPIKSTTSTVGAESDANGSAKVSSVSGDGVGSGGSPDVLKTIKRKILSAKRYPPMAKQRKLEGEVTVRFVIGSDGRIASSEMIASSGSAVLDQEAMSTLKRAEPYPTYLGAITMVLRFELLPK